MNILITGATGFIGRNLADALSKTNHSVRCLARENANVNYFRNMDVEISYGDLLVKDSFSDSLEEIDLVYHLAGEVYSRKGDDYYKGNVLTTRNLLEVCKEKRIRRIIYMSTVGVYKPKPDKTLLTEESFCEPITYYGKTKLYGEQLLKKYDIPFVIVRAPVIYGPTQPALINKFFIDILIKRKMYVIGDGSNLRSLCYISNLVEGLASLAEKQSGEGGIFLLSDNSSYTLNEIVTIASKVSGQDIKTVYLPDILADISWGLYNLMSKTFNLYFIELYAAKTMKLNIGCDIGKAHNVIGYNPKINLETGLKRTLEWINGGYHS